VKEYIKASVGFLKSMTTTGAIVESSSQTREEMTRFVDGSKPQLIVEYGTGTGVVTRSILAKMHPDSVLYSFEINKDFVETIEKIKDSRLHFYNRSADEVDQILPTAESVDLVISTVPITILPEELVDSLTEKGKFLLKDGGHFSQLVFSPIFKKHFKRYFGNCIIESAFNVPPAFIHHSEKNTH
jgi:phosphatidylethanolamine/phosphatidyl-N-methylethanolamine N-methyltransferase